MWHRRRTRARPVGFTRAVITLIVAKGLLDVRHRPAEATSAGGRMTGHILNGAPATAAAKSPTGTAATCRVSSTRRSRCMPGWRKAQHWFYGSAGTLGLIRWLRRATGTTQQQRLRALSDAVVVTS